MLFFRKNKRQFGIRSHRRVFVAMFLLAAVTSIAAILFQGARAELVPISSIELLSEHSDYENEVPGAWKVTKSAQWINTHQARITFQIDTIQMNRSEKKRDVVMVIDNSRSMVNRKMDHIKRNAKDLVDKLSEDTENAFSLITFNTSATILSGLTNNKTAINSLIDSIDIGGDTNYYDAFLKVREVLNGYVAHNNRELVILFLTDGRPNYGSPNEVAEYLLLKERYPDSIISGIQYDMGDVLEQSIINISDIQFVTDATDENNFLIDAAYAPKTYEELTITDYINDDYFAVADGADSIQASLGTATLGQDGETQTITWNLDGLLRSGQSATLTIIIDAENETALNNGTLMRSNKRESVFSRIAETQTEQITSEETPILRAYNKVVYEANAPSGCDVSGSVPETQYYLVFSTVEISQESLSCNGFAFKGWMVSNFGIRQINEDNFIMPGIDVTIEGVWGKPDISKSLDGTPHRVLTAEFDTGSTFNVKIKRLSGQNVSSYYGTTTTNNLITAIKTSSVLPLGFDTNNSANIVSSEDSETPIYAWFDEGIIYLYSEAEKIYLNENPRDMFRNLYTVTDISAASDWITSKATSLDYVFYGLIALEDLTPIANWDISNVTSAEYIFYYMKALTNIEPLRNWNTSKITSMAYMFSYDELLSDVDPLNSWDKSSVTNMSSMFSHTGLINLDDLSGWDMSNVENISYMFSAHYSLKDIEGIRNWDTSNITDISSIFSNNYSGLTDASAICDWDTSSVTNMHGVFYNTKTVANYDCISGWDTSKVTDMSYMFYEALGITSSSILGSWDTSKVVDMECMFNGAQNLKDIRALANWDITSLRNISGMFDWTPSLEGIEGLENWDTSKITDMSYTFSNIDGLTNLDVIRNWDTSSVENMSGMFSWNDNLEDISAISNWVTDNVTDISGLFAYNRSIYDVDALETKIVDGIKRWDLSNVTDMSSVFFQTFWLNDISALSSWDVSNVEDMEYFFYDTEITNVDPLSGWDVSKVTDMSTMFCNVQTLTDISGLRNWNVSSVEDMAEMFEYDTGLTDLSPLENWDVSSLYNMNRMFESISEDVTRPSWYEE